MIETMPILNNHVPFSAVLSSALLSDTLTTHVYLYATNGDLSDQQTLAEPVNAALAILRETFYANIK